MNLGRRVWGWGTGDWHASGPRGNPESGTQNSSSLKLCNLDTYSIQLQLHLQSPTEEHKPRTKGRSLPFCPFFKACASCFSSSDDDMT